MEDMSSGAIYVEVTASQVNSGINLLSSGVETGGEETGTYWLYWTSAEGFTSQGWHWDDPNNYLQTGWGIVADSYGFAPTQDGFLSYMETGPENLDDVLGGWPLSDKAKFAMQFGFVVDGGCVELV